MSALLCMLSDPIPAGYWRAQFDALGKALLATRPYWHPSPWRGRRPSWCSMHPELLELAARPELSLGDLEGPIPAAGAVARLSKLPQQAPRRSMRRRPHDDWAIPGRKLAQIEAFVSTMQTPAGALIDWCGGKGHLGRMLAAQFDWLVTTIDLDVDLLQEGGQLARRARVEGQVLIPEDALAIRVGDLAGRHVVALHACGELHRRLIREALRQPVAALDIVPCCYVKGAATGYHPLSTGAVLDLDSDDLRLAVTGAATNSVAERRLRERGEAWKAGLRRLVENECGRYLPLSRVPVEFLRGDFPAFCRQLSVRDGFPFPESDRIDWAAAEAVGWAVAEEVQQVNRVRLLFSRALEVWLLLDLAVALTEAGYQVTLGPFCDVQLTPRNLLLTAMRDQLGRPTP